MNKRILPLVLCAALLLSGCSAMLERGHETITTHVDYAVTEDESILRAETYQGLVNAMLYFVNGHRAQGTIRLYNYTGDVEADLANARDEVMYEDPLGAFSVRSLRYDTTRILTYYEVELRLTYSRTAAELNGLPEVTGLAGVRQELAKLIGTQRESSVFLASYFSGDQALIEQLVRLAGYSVPALYRHHDIRQITVSLYPETGTRRVIEVHLGWNQSADAVAEEEKGYAQLLETAASTLLESNPSAGEEYTVDELAAIVRSSAGPRSEDGTDLALDTLSGEPASDLGLAMAMEYLCLQCGIEAEPVSTQTELWLIVSTPQGYRHLLPQGLWPIIGGEPGGEPSAPQKLLYTDQELIELGYTWAESLHPACEDYAAQGEDAG